MWLISLACQKPKDLGYSYELWTNNLLAKHIRKHCHEVGHEYLSKISHGTISKILSKNDIKQHKIQYYLERRDPDFENKIVEVLCVYQEIALINNNLAPDSDYTTVVFSYDEKPGI
jgi:hypothetical protein